VLYPLGNGNKMRARKIVILILFFSLFLRLGVAYWVKDSFFERGNRYSLINPIANNIINFHEFAKKPGNPTASNEPLYPLFVALAYYLMGKNWLSLCLLQSILSLLNGIIVSFIALAIFKNNKVGLISLLLFCLYPYFITQSISVSDTVFFCFWLALSIYLMVLYRNSQEFFKNLLAGCCWGVTLLTRFSAISLFLFGLLYLFFNNSHKEAFKRCIIISFGCLLILSPWLYRNYELTNKLFIVTNRSAIAIWFGYNKETMNAIEKDISVDTMIKDVSKKLPDLEEIKRKKFDLDIMREVEEDKVFIRSAFNYALKNPWDSIKMMPLKLWKFWSWRYNPAPNSKNLSVDIFWHLIFTFSYLPILILGLIGIMLTRHTWRIHSILLLIFIGYSILHTVVYGFSRLRIPIDQFLMLYSAYSIVFYFERITHPKDVALKVI